MHVVYSQRKQLQYLRDSVVRWSLRVQAFTPRTNKGMEKKHKRWSKLTRDLSNYQQPFFFTFVN